MFARVPHSGKIVNLTHVKSVTKVVKPNGDHAVVINYIGKNEPEWVACEDDAMAEDILCGLLADSVLSESKS